jgi:multidrug efflux pump subunit AcrA (membrane-fusion protein)
MSRKIFRRALFVAAIGGASLSLLAFADDKGDGQTASSTATSASPTSLSNVEIKTEPSKSIPLSFSKAGIIAQRLVNDGDHVTKGQLLLKQDTDLDEQELNRLKVEAESDSRIDAAKADEQVKKDEYERESKAPAGYSPSEIDEAEGKYTEATKGVKVAEEDKEEAKFKYAEQQVMIQKEELHSPVDGTVQQMLVDLGQMSDPQNKDGAVLVVVNDPLWVEIRGLTTLQVSTLKLGEKLQVRYKNDPQNSWQDATISYITPVADAGADRQLVRLELPNPQNLAAGMNMEVNWPKKLLDTAPKDDQILSFK